MRSVSPVAPLRRALIGLASVILLAVLVAAGMLSAAAKDRPPGGVLSNPVVRAIDLASPAVVRIATLYDAHLRLSACGATTTLPRSGSYTVGGLGSGAFVSAHGDILTADHVVDIDRQSLDDSIFGGQHASADIAAFLNAACHPNIPVTANDVAAGIVQFNGFPFTTSYSAPRVLVWRSASFFGSIPNTATSATATQLTGLLKAPYEEADVLQTSSFGDDDLALIHVGLSDTPTIQLASSSELAIEDTLAVIGFPGNGDVNADPTNLLTPSVNNANVSAIKRNDNGSQLIQVGGNIEHGDSGGPALDTNGHIVGIVSFGGADDRGITAFLRSSDSALTLLHAAKIDTTPGAFQKMWEHAFATYADTAPGHWQAASREMDTLSRSYPDFHGLDAYRQYADTAAVREAAESSSAPGFISALPLPLPIMAAVVAAIFVLALLLIVVAAIRRRARRRARQQAQAALAPLPAMPSTGLPHGYQGATAPSYPPVSYYGSYGSPAQPTRPATPQQQPSPSAQGYASQPVGQPYQPVYAPSPAPTYSPYPNSAPQGNAPQHGGSQSGGSQNGNPWSSTASQPQPVSSPAPGVLSQDGTSDFCANGHPMQVGVARCAVCGAERAQAATTPRDANISPWAQNW